MNTFYENIKCGRNTSHICNGTFSKRKKGRRNNWGESQILLFLFRFVTGSHLVAVADLELCV